MVPSLVSQLFNPAFEAYEFLDALELTKEQTEAAMQNPDTQIHELLHQIAFRHGLGNPLYASADALHALKRSDLKEFAAKNFTADRITIVGTGIAHGELVKLVNEAFVDIKLPASASSVPRSMYYGGEARIQAGPHSEARYVIAYPAPGASSAEYAASKVLAALLGGVTKVKYATPNGVLGALSTSATKVAGFANTYTDAGLVGVEITGSADEVKVVAGKAVAAFKALSASNIPELLVAAKKAAVIEAEAEFSTNVGLLESLSKHPEISALQLTAAISAVSYGQVQKVNCACCCLNLFHPFSWCNPPLPPSPQ